MINVPLIKDVNIIEIMLILGIIGLITTISILNVYHWKQRSENFKIMSRIISVPLVFLTCITTACLIIPYEALNKLHRPILIHLAQFVISNTALVHFLKWSVLVLVLALIFNLCSITKDKLYKLEYRQKNVPMRKQAPHLVYSMIIGILMIILLICQYTMPSFMTNKVAQSAYKYHTSRTYYKKINHIKPTKGNKIIKRDIQHFNGKTTKNVDKYGLRNMYK